MSEERKSRRSGPLVFSLGFFVVFGLVFSLGVVVGKKYIPADAPVAKDSEPEDSQLEGPQPEDSERKSPGRDEYLSAMLNPDHKYTIQVNSFQNGKVANRTVRFYKDRGYPAFIREYSPSDITTFYRVRIGTFESKEAAREYGHEISERERDFKFYVTLND